MNDWNATEVSHEQQELVLPPCGQISQPLCNQTFTLTYQQLSTSPLPINTNAKGLEQALNGLATISNRGHVNVSLVTGTTYKIDYSFPDPNDVQLLTSTSANGTSISIRRIRRGVTSKTGFKLSYGGAVSGFISPVQVTAAKLEQTFTDFFSVKCTKSSRKYTTNDVYLFWFSVTIISFMSLWLFFRSPIHY